MNKKLIRKVNAIYNKQVAKNEASILDKKLFNLSTTLTIGDWREIRGKEFWEHMDDSRNDEYLLKEFRRREQLKEGSGKSWFWWALEIKKKEYTLKKVTEYLRNTQ